MLTAAQAQIDRFVQDMRLPQGFSIERLAGEDKQTVYYWMIAIGALLIYMLLAAQFESLSTPLVILGTVPTAIIGALITLTLSGTPLSLGEGAPMALLGLIVLLGIVVNNGIILLDRISLLQHRHGYRWQRAVIVAGQSRVRPIIMTSATTILGLFPLSLKQGTEFELWPPFAITVLGGLLISAFATLIFVPVLYVGIEQTKTWLRKIGVLGISAATILAGGMVYWYYSSYGSLFYTTIIILPVWFSFLGLIYAGQRLVSVRQEKQRLASGSLIIEVQNLTKIYGSPGRFSRQWHRQKRRWQKLVRQGILPWQRDSLTESVIWMSAIGALLIYLHGFFTNGFWITVISATTLAWLFGVREFWYRWRFINNLPVNPEIPYPAWLRMLGRWCYQVLLFGWLIRLVRRGKAPAPEPAETAPESPLHFRRQGTVALVLLFLGYLQLRQVTPWLVIPVLVLTLLIANFNRIARKIERGDINPEEPQGKFRKIKRGFYLITRALPFIRPPKQKVVALQSVNLTIGKGMFGLLGPNGAGKSTLMRILVGVLEQDRGSIKINGMRLDENRETFHATMGYLPQNFGLYENMTPLEYLNHHALTNGIYESENRRALIGSLIESVGLWERRNDKIKSFSGGMKQRVGIAQTLLHLPQIIVVDEPTVGLDPRERIRFRNLLSDLAKDRIVVFSTHIVEDISSTCHDVAVLNRGKLVFRGAPEEMQKQAAGMVFEVVIPDEQLTFWQTRVQVTQHSKAAGGIRMRFLADKPIAELQAQAVEPTLEDAYVYLLRDNGTSGGSGGGRRRKVKRGPNDIG
jgi:ABC-type multidrug transport system ATPase subunit